MAAAAPLLTYWDRAPPFACVALSKYAGVELKHEADPKATKETVPTLQFDGGCVIEPPRPTQRAEARSNAPDRTAHQ
jgi:hypothetical protein